MKDHPLYQLTLARWREFYREPGAVFWVFGFPVLMAVGLGIAFRNKEPEPPRVVVVQSHESAWLEAKLSSERLEVSTHPQEEAERLLSVGGADILVFAHGPGAAEPRGVHFRFDPTRAEARLARALVNDTLQRAAGRIDTVSVEDEAVTARGSRYIDYLLPGLIGLNLMSSSLWGIGYSVVLMRKRRLLRRFFATPMKRSHYLLSYILSRMVFLGMELAALLLFGFLAFGVEIQGSVLTMGILGLLGAIAFAGMGLLIAARTESVEAASGWINFATLPMWLLSGAFFSYERFPEFTHGFIRLLPLTALNDSLRAVTNEGATLLSQWPELAVMGVWGGACFLLALRFFRWQ